MFSLMVVKKSKMASTNKDNSLEKKITPKDQQRRMRGTMKGERLGMRFSYIFRLNTRK